jgi:hypothetical protein
LINARVKTAASSQQPAAASSQQQNILTIMAGWSGYLFR